MGGGGYLGVPGWAVGGTLPTPIGDCYSKLQPKNVYKLELRGTENFKRGIPDTFGAMCEATLKS